MSNETQSCSICGSPARAELQRKGRISPEQSFTIYHCPNCRFSFVGNPRVDFENIYSMEYYSGRGADPLVNYLYDYENHSNTVKQYEWAGLVKIYRDLTAKHKQEMGDWLDYGCGLGGLMRYAQLSGLDMCGYDSSRIIDHVAIEKRDVSLKFLEPEELGQGKWRFITAIEVLEHTLNPLETLGEIRKLLRPGGILFLTTGNAEPWRHKLDKWPYTSCPDVHISFFEPSTLALALEKTGFIPIFPGYSSGFNDVIKNKVLKTLGAVNKNRFFDLLPWPVISRLVDARYKVSSMPYGVAA